jgi:hypothetical protein
MLIFVGSAFFRDDTRLRALRFLDHMLVCTFIAPHKLRIIYRHIRWIPYVYKYREGSLYE